MTASERDFSFHRPHLRIDMKAIAPSLRRNLTLQALVLVTLTPGLILNPVPLRANPQGPNVVAGNVNFQGLNSARLNINNQSNRAIINWQSFSIDQGEVTTINQGANAFTLNRVVSGNPSAIYGRLEAARGGVAVVNPNGITVHKGGVIDVAGMMTLSTLDISNKDFLNGGADRFRGTSTAGVANYGAITSQSGDVVLLGNFLQNAGEVNAPRGVVAFGAGGDIVVDQMGESRISVQAGGSGGQVGIDNTGAVNAAAAELKAHGNVYALAIKNDGVVRASGYNFRGGRLTLSAGPQGRIVNTGNLTARNADGSGGQIQVSGGRVQIASGSVDAAGEAGQVGGSVSITGSEVAVDAGASVEVGGSAGGSARISGSETTTIAGAVNAVGATGGGGNVIVEGREVVMAASSSMNASGATAGGSVQAGGGFQGRDATIRNAESLRIADGASIAADATASGRGGAVILWADQDTLFEGDVRARGVSAGGFVEISGKETLAFIGNVDVTATQGRAGTLLLDPTDVTISAAAASPTNINNVSLSTLLDQGTNVIITSNFGPAGPAGNITVNERVEWYQEDAATTPGSLTLLAVGNINFNRSVRSAGTGGISVVAGWDGFTGLVSPLSGAAQTNGSGFNMAAVLATMNDGNVGNDAAGLNSGSVFVNSALGAQFVEVGSRFGATNLAAHDLFLTAATGGADRWAHVGFHDSGYEYNVARTYFGTRNEWWGTNSNAAGGQLLDSSNLPIAFSFGNVRNKNYVADLGGTELVFGAFKGAGYGATGPIEIGLSGRLDMRGMDTQSRNYVQIGHGGTPEGESTRAGTANPPSPSRTTRDGIVIDPGDDGRPFFSGSWRTNYLGHAGRTNAPITVTAAEDIYISAPRGLDAGFETITTPDSSATGSYAAIGHGGFRQSMSGHGDITVTAHGAVAAGAGLGTAGAGIQLFGGGGSGAYAQIGHHTSGTFNRRTIWDQQNSGTINVTATTGAIRAIGFNQLPRSGAASDRNTGTILGVNTPLGINSAMDPTVLHSHVQIGHGGSAENEPATGGSFTAAGTVNFLYDAFNNATANTGAAVTNRRPEQSMNGDITVFAGGTVRVRDNMGFDNNGNWVADPGPGTDPYLFAGSSALTREIGIEVRAGNMFQGYGMIGNGGTQFYALETASTGHTGNISVTADKGGILFIGGEEKRADRPWGFGYNFVQIGNGGRNVQGPKQGAITVSAGQGAGALDGDIMFRSGRMRQSWAQIGHGGQEVTRAITGDGLSGITVTARDNIEMTSRISAPSNVTLSADYVDFAMGENGSGSAGNSELAERVVGTLGSGTQIPQSAIQAMNWDTNIKFAMIGHGGSSVNMNGVLSLNNEINVNAQTGGIRMTTSGGDRDWTHIGHGGYRTGGVPSIVGANVNVSSARDITVDASSSGDIMMERTSMFGVVFRDGPDVTDNFLSMGQTVEIGRGFAAYGMIGNGGYDFDGDHSGNITVSAGGDFTMIGPRASSIFSVSGYTSGYVEGPGNNPTDGVNNYWIASRSLVTADPTTAGTVVTLGGSDTIQNLRLQVGTPVSGDGWAPGTFITAITSPNTFTVNLAPTAAPDNTTAFAIGRHALNTLQEASQMTRTLQLYHGNTGPSEIAHRGNILPGTLLIDIASTGGQDLRDAPNGPGATTGTLYRAAAVVTGDYTVATHGPSFGTIDYTTGKVTISTVGITANNGDLENDRNQVNRNINYTYFNSTLAANVAISAERTGESDTAVRPNEAFLGHGRIMPGSLSLNIGSAVLRENPALNGEIFSAPTIPATPPVVVATIDYDTGRIRFRANVNPTGAPVSANYQWTTGNADSAFVMLGNGGQGSSTGGRDTIGSLGEISLTAGGDVRFHAGAFSNTFAQLGHGGTSSQSANSGNIAVNSGGIVEFMAGNTLGYLKTNQYAQLGHGGFDADGSHLGNITINGGSGAMSTAPGTIGGGALGGLVFKAGNGQDTYAMLGHGGRSSQAGVATQLGLAAGQAGRLSGTITANVGGAIQVIAGTKIAHPFDNVRNNDDGRNFAQIGHGGWDSDATAGTYTAGTGFLGDISLTTTEGNVLVQAGNIAQGSFGSGFGRYHWAQIGHGGLGTSGDHTGNISVITENGGVRVEGGMATQDVDALKTNYAQIGHVTPESTGALGSLNETIKVYAFGPNGDVTVAGGNATRGGAQIGHGGYANPGDKLGDIKVIANNNMEVRGGSVAGTDNYGKVGHGDQRNSSLSVGNLFGDIEVSVGETLRMGQGIIGHTDTRVTAANPVSGNTFIAVGRNNPNPGGTGSLITTSASVITSAAGGTMGEELRLYMPDSSSNLIAAGTRLNNVDYVRVPAPGSNRSDEQFAVEHQFPAGGATEADATFTPEGAYPGNSFGLYNIYYAGTAPIDPGPVVPPVTPIPPQPPVTPPPPYDFLGFFAEDTFDAFFRDEELFLYDGYDEVLASIAYGDAMEDDSPIATGGSFIEELLDSSVGDRRYSEIEPGSDVLEDEDDEELWRRKLRAARPVGKGSLTYYVFDPGTNRYSSFRVFGVEQTKLSVTQ
jgi:filamentous hemagglutinin family protein